MRFAHQDAHRRAQPTTVERMLFDILCSGCAQHDQKGTQDSHCIEHQQTRVMCRVSPKQLMILECLACRVGQHQDEYQHACDGEKRTRSGSGVPIGPDQKKTDPVLCSPWIPNARSCKLSGSMIYPYGGPVAITFTHRVSWSLPPALP